MPLMTESIEYRRLRAPKADGGTLIDPPRAAVDSLLERNRDGLSAADCDIAGRRLVELSAQARADLFAAATGYTREYRHADVPAEPRSFLLAGHQPQLFHPGVWYKNFVLGQLAAEQEGVAINLVIDSDAIRSTAIRVPTGSIGQPSMESIEFDTAGPSMPYEERAILDRAEFESFGQHVTQTISPLVADPLIREFWPRAIDRARHEANLGLAISQARHVVEGEWKSNTLELPQSRLCGFESFRRFLLHLLIEAPRLREVYNAAVGEYRRVHHLRGKAHPVPELAAVDGWNESPLWIWTTADPTRRRLFVKSSGQELRLTDRAGLEFSLAVSPDAALEQLAALSARGIKLRTKALITTMFARLVLSDLFVHGIGGAKYDQVTDAIIRRFFSIEPPSYLTVTATLRLPIGRSPVSEEDLRLVDDRLRELAYHPERWLDDRDGAAHALASEKRRWIAEPQTQRNARERCHAIRSINESLQPHLGDLREKLLAERDSLWHSLRAEAILSSREYAFCLYPEQTLRGLTQTA